ALLSSDRNMKPQRRSQVSSSRGTRMRSDMLQQQREIIGLNRNGTSSVESYASSLLLKFIARRDVTMTDLFGVSRQHGSLEDACESARKRDQVHPPQSEPAEESGGPARRRRRLIPSRSAQLAVLLLCHGAVLSIGMFLFGLTAPMLLRQSPVTEPWFSMWLSGCCSVLLLLLAFALPAVFPSLLGACCHGFMRHLRLDRYHYK
ncbi:hypothetical protein BOX15_Mlig033734g3, partial [Macrostomum lignano]